MSHPGRISTHVRGFSMIEVLVSLVIVVFGLLGLAGLQIRIQKAELESYQRAQALILLQDMVDRIHLHRATATCFRFTSDTTAGTPYLGVGSGGAPSCSAGTANDNLRTTETMNEWNALLQGAAETKGGAAAGAMSGARGCVSYDATTELLDPTGGIITDTGVYTVAISWAGTIDTFAPTINCGNDTALYGAETRRRVVSTTFRLAYLK